MKEALFNIFNSDQYPIKASDLAVYESSWRSPSNIALVKYWGKKGNQLPANPSLSLTLSAAHTETTVKAIPEHPSKGIISLNDDPNHPFIPKLLPLLEFLISRIPTLGQFGYEIQTTNTFPHSTGIASSASGLSALSLCLLDIACTVHSVVAEKCHMVKLASYTSRLGSGSACRSVIPGYSVWGETGLVSGSSDYFAVDINNMIHPDFNGMKDAILVVSSAKKSMASTAGHRQMNLHPFAQARIAQANMNLQNILESLQSGDFQKLSLYAENEALSLHALMMSAESGTILMAPGTIEMIKKIRKARKDGLNIFFTLDAGPNIHMLYPAAIATEVKQYVENELTPLCEENRVIFDQEGNGPERIFSGVLNPC
jgi:diphosphomevalonate decarboxylase